MVEHNEYTTVAIYKEDMEYLTNIAKKNETFREVLHYIIMFYKTKEDLDPTPKKSR